MKGEAKDILIGVGLGLIIPAVAFLLLSMIYSYLGNAGMVNSTGFSPSFRKRTVTLVAICANLIPFSIFNKRRNFSSMRGIMLATVVYGAVWIFYFGSELLSE